MLLNGRLGNNVITANKIIIDSFKHCTSIITITN